jgi:hypothetical protein
VEQIVRSVENMATKTDSRIYIINSYQFETKEEYEQALQEKNGINYLNAQLDVNNIEKVYQLYTELVDKKIFITVIGIEYLKKLRGILLRDSRFSADNLRPIRISTVNKQVKNRVEKYISSKYETEVRQHKKEKEGIRNKLNTSIIINVVLVIMLIAMFFISKSSSNPTIIDYERKLQDKYASWESDLKEKEQELKDLEWELKELGVDFNK